MATTHPRETWEPTDVQRTRAIRVAKRYLSYSPWAWLHAIRYREWLASNPTTVRGTKNGNRELLLVEFWNAEAFPDWQNYCVRDGFPDHLEMLVDPQNWRVLNVHRTW